MNCKIMWCETKCNHQETGLPGCGALRNKGICRLASREISRGFEGQIQEYSIERNGYTESIEIKVNNRRKIELVVDVYGYPLEESCPCEFQDVIVFEIDGKPVSGYEPNSGEQGQSK